MEDREAIVAEVLIPVAKAAGYDFTLEDLKAFEKSMQVEGELSENELESVAGGGDHINGVDYSGGIKNWGLCVVVGLAGGRDCIVGGLALCIVAGF